MLYFPLPVVNKYPFTNSYGYRNNKIRHVPYDHFIFYMKFAFVAHCKQSLEFFYFYFGECCLPTAPFFDNEQ